MVFRNQQHHELHISLFLRQDLMPRHLPEHAYKKTGTELKYTEKAASVSHSNLNTVLPAAENRVKIWINYLFLLRVTINPTDAIPIINPYEDGSGITRPTKVSVPFSQANIASYKSSEVLPENISKVIPE